MSNYHYNSTTPPTHRALSLLYQTELDQRIASGLVKPSVFPHDSFGLVVLIAYLLIPHRQRPWLRRARWLVAAFIFCFDVNILLTTSTTWVGTGFGSGLVVSWGAVWSLTWLVWGDPQAGGVRRVIRREVVEAGYKEEKEEEKQRDGGEVRRRKPKENRYAAKGDEKDVRIADRSQSECEYSWQSFPEYSFRDRLDWVSDLIFNFRGPGWDWEVPTNPGLPPHIKTALGLPVDPKEAGDTSSAGVRRYNSRTELLRAQLPRLIIGYLMLDVLKVTLMKDPYFLIGPSEFPAPVYLADLSPFALGVYRQLLTFISIITALETILRIAPIACLCLPERLLGLRGEAWMYPTTWGSLDVVFTRGLSGLWGGWWHQTFRYAFAAPTAFLIKHNILSPRSPTTKLVGLFIAFGLSGFIHAAGSLTQFPATKPLNLFSFFVLQALGIVLQTAFCDSLSGQIAKIPTQWRSSANFAWCFTWLYCTSPLLNDDFARGGVWLFQPVPISVVRGLGWGDEGDGWWCWEVINIRWFSGQKWWESGLAF